MIKDLKELEAFLKLCRKQGITEITLDGTTVKFGALPRKPRKDTAEDSDDIESDGLTPEQMIFFSARPPEDA